MYSMYVYFIEINDSQKVKKVVDPFYNIVSDKYIGKDEEKKIHLSKKISMNLGTFHEKMMSSFCGYEKYKQGDATHCDIGKKDGSIVIEVKNSIHTTNGDSFTHTIDKLKKQASLGKVCYFVQVNSNRNTREYCKDVYIISGKNMYSILSGRTTFYEDLLSTFEYVFNNFDAIKKELYGNGQILNPVKQICNADDDMTCREIKNGKEKILNPVTGRYVNADGRIGRKIKNGK